MPSQINYYNHFGEQHTDSIINCPEPELWTTDYLNKGRIYREMKKRIGQQQQLILEFFKKDFPVLDVGCGFGRQAYLLAKNGYKVTGTDTSNAFIEIAKKLFTKNNYLSDFYCMNILETKLNSNFRQVLLLDVLEHIKPSQRISLWKRLSEILNEKGGIMILSVPHVKNRFSSVLNNNIRKRFTQYFSYFLHNEEHAFPIPGKNEIIKQSERNFSLLKFIGSDDTDYYVFLRN